MALSIPSIYAALAANRASGVFPFAGVNFDQMATGVAAGIVQWGVGQPQNLGLAGLATGAQGNGVILPPTSKLVVVPAVSVMSAALLGAGMAGPLSQSLATIIAFGVSAAFNTVGQYSGVSGSVAVGADVSKVVACNAATLIAILQMTLAGALGSGGPALPQMATGLGNGIAGLLWTAAGTGVITGVPSSTTVVSGPTFSVVV